MLNPFNIWPECIGPGAERFRGLEKLCDFTGGYNPMSTLNPQSDNFVPDAEGLGQAIVYQEREGEHWTDSARDLVTGLIMYAAVYGKPAKKSRMGAPDDLQSKAAFRDCGKVLRR